MVLVAPDGRQLWYATRGSGRTVVCLPGGPGISSRLLGDLGGLDRDCRLVLVDPRGSGRSDPPAGDGGYRLDDYVADLELLREHLALPGMTVLGHSAGALIALAYAAQYRSRVDLLVLVGAFARFAEEHAAIAGRMRAARSDEPWYAEAVAAADRIGRADLQMPREELGDLIARSAGFCYASYGDRQVAHASLFREGVDVAGWLAVDDSTDLRALLPKVTAPALVVAGEQDCLIP